MSKGLRKLFGPLARAQQSIFHYVLGSTAFFSPEIFPATKKLEENWTEIRDELLAMLPQNLPYFHDVVPGETRISDTKWKVIMLRVWSLDVPENCRSCPRTTAILAEVPDTTTAFFSILEPGKHIPAHRGFYPGVLRYHLGLLVPKDSASCRIRVGNEVRTWEAGKGMVFDDTLEHEVWNESDEPRVVLFMDIIRPLPWYFDWINRLGYLVIAKTLMPLLIDRKRLAVNKVVHQ